MSDDAGSVVPFWTLATSDVPAAPALAVEAGLTRERLSELRSALAMFATVPVVTLEAHPLPKKREPGPGLRLDAVSPLAQELARLVAARAESAPAVAHLAESSEVLFKMVVPAKVAAQVGKGLLKPMASKAVANGVYDGLVDSTTHVLAAKATFVPVQAAAAGAAGGTAVGTVAAGTAITVAAPLILMAVAVGASAYADHQRQRAIEHITELLQKLHNDRLEQERNELDGCRDAIDKATALLLDRGRVGASLGLDSAVHAISTATETANRRVKAWEEALDNIGDDRIEVSELDASFAGIGEDGGEFRTHVELAALAIALKRRVVILQAVEAGQSDAENPFQNFVRSLKADQQRIDQLEARIGTVLRRLSALELRSPKRLVDKLMTRGQVDGLLETSYRLRALWDGVEAATPNAEVVIEIEKHSDGTLLVRPPRAA